MAAATSIARSPEQMRNTLRYVNILDGDGAAWEEGQGSVFTPYDNLVEWRLVEHDLDETVFHESAHVAVKSGNTRLDFDRGLWQRQTKAFVSAKKHSLSNAQ